MLRSRNALWFKIAFIAAAGLLFIVVFERAKSGTNLVEYSLYLHVFERFISQGNYLFFVVINIFSIAYISIRLTEEGALTLSGLGRSIRGKKIVDVEALVLVAAAGMSTWLVFGRWSAAFYFDNIQMWIALPLVTAFLTREGGGWWRRLSQEARTRRLDAAAVIILVLLAPALKAATSYLHKGVVKIAKDEQLAREVYFGQRPQRIWLREPVRLLEPGPPQPSAGLEAVRRVLELRARYGRALIVYVPITNSEFWSIQHNCWCKSLFIPAMTGVPMLDGLPPIHCKHHNIFGIYEAYGLTDYRPRTSDEVLDRDRLCSAALAKGFGVVFFYASITHPERNHLYDCREGTPGT